MKRRSNERKIVNAWVLKALRGYDPVRVENACGDGTPDINCSLAWIESKWIESFPARGGVVKVPKYTRGQRSWHMRRRAIGGNVYVVIGVGDTLFTFDARLAATHLGIDWTHDDFWQNALFVVDRNSKGEDFAWVIRHNSRIFWAPQPMPIKDSRRKRSKRRSEPF